MGHVQGDRPAAEKMKVGLKQRLLGASCIFPEIFDLGSPELLFWSVAVSLLSRRGLLLMSKTGLDADPEFPATLRRFESGRRRCF